MADGTIEDDPDGIGPIILAAAYSSHDGCFTAGHSNHDLANFYEVGRIEGYGEPIEFRIDVRGDVTSCRVARGGLPAARDRPPADRITEPSGPWGTGYTTPTARH